MRVLSSYIRNFDYFGAQMQFRIKEEGEHKSVSGGIATVILFTFSLFYVITNFINFANKENVSLIFTNKINEQNPYVNLTELEFSMAFAIIYDEGWDVAFNETNKYFDYELNLVSSDFTTWDIKNVKIPLKQCIHKDFSDFTEHKFKSNNLNNFLCPETKNINYTLSGLWTDDYYQYMELSITIKEDQLENMDEINNFLLKCPLKLIVYMRDTAIMYDNLNAPTPPYLNYFESIINPSIYNVAELSISVLQFSSDNNLFLNNPIITQSIKLDQTNQNYFVCQNRTNFVYKNYLSTYYFKASTKLIQINRTYQKIPEFLANMSGLISQILFFFYITFTFINQKGAEQTIINNSMKFYGNKKFDVNYLLEKFNKLQNENFNCDKNKNSFLIQANIDAIKEKNINIELEKIVNIDTSTGTNKNSKVKKIENKFNNLSDLNGLNIKSELNKNIPDESSRNLKIINLEYNKSEEIKRDKFSQLKTFETILSSLLCCRKNKRTQLISNAESKLHFYMDILTYIKKMQEIDLLKYILLTPEQLCLLNFLSKPPILLNEIESEVYKDFEKEQKISLTLNKEEIDKIIDSYSNIINKEELSYGDKKLVNLLLGEIENINK